MREIVFRGKRAKDGKWVDGSLFSSMTGQKFIRWEVEDDGAIEEIVQYEVNPETIGQFTGLTDKNGKRVFEGDILQWVDEDNTCEGSKLIFIVKFDGEYEGFFGEGEFDNIEPWQFRNHEVIGNIHDKPELLEA